MSTPEPALVALARGLLPAGVAVAWADPRLNYPLRAGETIVGVPARKAEFSAGRHAARACLMALGRPEVAIPAQPDRSPFWPAGVVGSISHSADTCLAALAPDTLLRGLGIDLEPDLPLEENLWDIILLPAELEWLDTQSPDLRGHWAKRIFCAKEAAYKAQYAQSAALFGFDGMQIVFGEAGQFTVMFTADVPPFTVSDLLHGAWAQIGGQLLAVATLPVLRT